jgi:hypothetical protein
MSRYVGLLALLAGTLAAVPVALGQEPDPAAAIARLAVQRREAARRTYEVTWIDYRERRASLDGLYRWSVRWLEADRQLSDQPADQVAAFKAHFERMRDLDRLIRKLRAAGQTTIDETSAAEFYRTEAEMWVLQAQQDKKKR